MLVSTTLHFATGSIVADSQEPASGLMVITSGSVAVEIPHSSVMKSDSEAGITSQGDDGSNSLLYVFMRGCVFFFLQSLVLAAFDLNSYHSSSNCINSLPIWLCPHRDTIGDSAIIGDYRWAGTFGVQADFVATTHCSVAFISTQDIQVTVSRGICINVQCSPCWLYSIDNRYWAAYLGDLIFKRVFFSGPWLKYSHQRASIN